MQQACTPGLTLIEVLVALGLAAIVALMSLNLLTSRSPESDDAIASHQAGFLWWQLPRSRNARREHEVGTRASSGRRRCDRKTCRPSGPKVARSVRKPPERNGRARAVMASPERDGSFQQTNVVLLQPLVKEAIGDLNRQGRFI